MQVEYGLKFKEIKGMDAGLLLTALNSGKVDISVGYGTDGRISKYGLKIIEDDKNFFPPYNVAPLIKETFMEKYPSCYEVINILSNKISETEMQRLNLKVSDGNVSPREVAKEYLEKVGLL